MASSLDQLFEAIMPAAVRKKKDYLFMLLK